MKKIILVTLLGLTVVSGLASAGEEALDIGDGFALEGFLCKDNPMSGIDYVQCDGKVVNSTAQTAKVGTVAILYSDKNGGLLDTSTVEMNLDLETGDDMPFQTQTPKLRMAELGTIKVEHRAGRG